VNSTDKNTKGNHNPQIKKEDKLCKLLKIVLPSWGGEENKGTSNNNKKKRKKLKWIMYNFFRYRYMKVSMERAREEKNFEFIKYFFYPSGNR
jgi:hypothetical protein